MEKVIGEEIGYSGVSVIICRRECIQTAKRHAAVLTKSIKSWQRKTSYYQELEDRASSP